MKYYKEYRHTTLSMDKIKHCKGVADYMQENAELFGLNKDVAYFIGLNHDIGYVNGRIGHEKSGWELLSGVGVNPTIVNAILNHGKNPYSLLEKERTPELQLLWCADMSVDKFGERTGFDGRLADIESRYGHDSIAYQTASDTIRYCKEILKEKTDLKHEHFHFLNSDYVEPNKEIYYKFGLDYAFLKTLFNQSLLPKIRFMEKEDNIALQLELPEYKDTLIHQLNRAFSHKDLKMEYINEMLFQDKEITLPGEDIKKLKDTLRLLNDYREGRKDTVYTLNNEELKNLENVHEIVNDKNIQEEVMR